MWMINVFLRFTTLLSFKVGFPFPGEDGYEEEKEEEEPKKKKEKNLTKTSKKRKIHPPITINQLIRKSKNLIKRSLNLKIQISQVKS